MKLSDFSSVDDCLISVSLNEFVSLLNNARSVPVLNRQLKELQDKYDGLHRIYLDILERLDDLRDF